LATRTLFSRAAHLTKKPKLFEEIFDATMLAARDEPVCQTIENTLQPVFASTHALLRPHLQNCDVFDSLSFAVFAPASGNLVATSVKSRSPFRIASQKGHSLYNSQIDRIVPPSVS
jgi:hypothetical protein